jgi:low temperature requirement protein LtrA
MPRYYPPSSVFCMSAPDQEPTARSAEGRRRPAIRIRMTGRSSDEAHRVSSPLELLFDLTFVVAISQVSAQLAEAISGGDALADLAPYAMVFFAIWWAWMNFTWFASAYDTDDVPYRLFTLIQMAGVLVLAAGVPTAFSSQNFFAVTIGYLIMRIGLVAQWVRAAVENPAGRRTALRYAAGISIVQIGWVSRLALPPSLGGWSFVILAAADLSVPLWAERTGMSSWHPHHIAERYGLFTMIVLGESVSASTIGVQRGLSTSGVSATLVTIAAAGLVLLFGLWWLYFLNNFGDGLDAHRSRSFLWGYGHYFVFASLAAVGAGLEVAVGGPSNHPAITAVGVAYAIAIPVAIYLAMLQVLHAMVAVDPQASAWPTAIAVILVVATPLACPIVGLAAVIVGVALIVAALNAVAIIRSPQQNGPSPAR